MIKTLRRYAYQIKWWAVDVLFKAIPTHKWDTMTLMRVTEWIFGPHKTPAPTEGCTRRAFVPKLVVRMYMACPRLRKVMEKEDLIRRGLI